jgi:hypothetical protein
LTQLGRNMNATWRTTGSLCRVRDWSRQRLQHELQNGLRYRTIPEVLPEGYEINWRNPRLDVEASTVAAECPPPSKRRGAYVVLTVGIEVWDGEAPAAPSVEFAITATRKLRAENRIPKGVTKAKLALLLEAESQKGGEDGQSEPALKASYLENQLDAWGIWPLSGSARFRAP